MVTLAYVTLDDLRRLRVLQEQTVMVVKAPEETKLEIPAPTEVRPESDSAPRHDIIIIIIITEPFRPHPHPVPLTPGQGPDPPEGREGSHPGSDL